MFYLIIHTTHSVQICNWFVVYNSRDITKVGILKYVADGRLLIIYFCFTFTNTTTHAATRWMKKSVYILSELQHGERSHTRFLSFLLTISQINKSLLKRKKIRASLGLLLGRFRQEEEEGWRRKTWWMYGNFLASILL